MRKANPLLFQALLALTFARLLIAAGMELSALESYYALWSLNPNLGYHGKGPGIAAAMWLSNLLPAESTLTIRFLSPLLGLATSLLLFRLAHALFDSNIAAWSVILINVTPIFNASSILFTTETLAAFFWITTMICLWRAIHRAHPWNPWWPLTGLFIGLGTLCELTSAFQLLSLFLLLLAGKRWRGHLRKPGPWLLLLTFSLCFLPFLIWNANNHWISFSHLLQQANVNHPPHLSNFASFLSIQSAYLSPLILIGLLWASGKAIHLYGRDPATTFLAAFALPILTFHFALPITDASTTHSTTAAFLPIAILLVHFFHSLRLTNHSRTLLRSSTLGLAMLMTFVALQTDLIRKMGVNWPHKNDPSSQIKGWQTTASAITKLLNQQDIDPANPPFLIASDPRLASQLAFYLPDQTPNFQPDPSFPRVHTAASPIIRSQFSLWPRYDSLLRNNNQTHSPFLGRNAYFLTTNTHSISPPTEINDAFSHVAPITILRISRLGSPLRYIKIFACSNYRGLDL